MIQEKALSPDSLEVAATLENYASLLYKMGRSEEAGRLESRAATIKAKII